MKIAGGIGVLMLAAGLLRATASPAAGQPFNPRDYPGPWAVVTNRDGTITATEYAIRRQGDEVFRRVLTLRTVSDGQPMANPFMAALAQGLAGSPENIATTPELLEDLHHAASEAEIRNFIRQYRPPAISYTSAADAERTGRRKFDCVEFAADLVAHARARGIPAELVGIFFAGETIGHACAGFPTADGRVLYFDSTPGPGAVSWRACQARVAVGESYQRDGGGELAVVGKRPITQILPDFNQLEPNGGTSPAAPPGLVLAGESRVRVAGIEYAGPDTLQVSAAQLLKWHRAVQSLLAAQTVGRDKASSVH